MNFGLDYKPGVLETLKVLSPSPGPSSPPFPVPRPTQSNTVTLLPPSSRGKEPWSPPPIRLLPPSLFTHLHRQHLISHPPDHVLFPFLHGLEGDNEAQNTFFANASAGSHWVVGVEVPVIPPGHARMPQSHTSIKLSLQQGSQGGSSGGGSAVMVQHHQLLRPKVPRYRGLVWVVCEEDVKGSGDKVTLSVLRRKPLPRASDEFGVNSAEHDDEDMDFDSSDDSWGEDTSESSWEEEEDDSDDVGLADDERDVDITVVNVDDAHATTEGLGPIAAKPVLQPSALVKSKSELTKEEMDSMSYMHPVVSPLSQPQSQHHPNLSSINTSFPPPPPESDTDTSSVSPSISSSVDAGSTSTAPTSVSGSPISASLSSGYPQVIALEEVQTPPPINLDLTSAGDSKKKTKKVKDSSTHTSSAGGKAKKSAKGAGKAKQTDPAAPPLLTCTFRPKELLRKRRAAPGVSSVVDLAESDAKTGKGDQAVWEFVPARVPNGISLRNFGIQMPVYATISDIVIYSPNGPTKASVALAERFREAIARKRRERVDALKGVVYQQVHGNPANTTHFIKIEDVLKAEKERLKARRQEKEDTQQPSETTVAEPRATPATSDTTQTSYPTPPSPSPSNSPAPSDSDSATSDIDEDEEDDLETRMLDTAERYLLALVEDDLLDYNVFVLDGGEEELREMSSPNEGEKGGLAHLMMRSCGAGVPGGVDHGRMGVVPPPESAESQKGRANAIAKMTGRNVTTKTGPHTIGRDGELQGEREIEEREDADAGRVSVEQMDVDSADTPDVDMDLGPELVVGDVDMDVALDGPTTEAREVLDVRDDDSDLGEYPLFPNTVDFALREKEEMRDLTKASEIISMFPLDIFKPGSTASSPPGSASSGKTWTGSPPPVPAPFGSGTQAPNHLQHLAKLVPPSSPNRPGSPVPQQPGSTIPEYTFTHPDTSVDISSPATFFDPRVGQVFLGNSGDVPLSANAKPAPRVVRNASIEDEQEQLPAEDPFNYLATNDPTSGFGYDICIECHEMAPFPTPAHVRAAEEHLGVLEVMWRDRCVEKEKARRRDAKSKSRAKRKKIADEDEDADDEDEDEDPSPIIIPPRPPPHANAVVHLPFPSSPPNTQATMAQLMPVIRFLEKWIRPVPGEVKIEVEVRRKKAQKDTTPTPGSHEQTQGQPQQQGASGVRRWSSSVASLMPSVFGSSNNSNNASASPPVSATSSRSRSFTTPAPSSHHRTSSTSSTGTPAPAPKHPTRPLKLLLYSADGYTESSLAALCLLMSIKGLTLPEAYLDLQVGKRRSFFVYGNDLGVLRRMETRMIEERERERERLQRERERQEMERMVREAREREARERIVREERQRADERSARDEDHVNANGKRTIGSVHAGTGGQGPEKPGGLSLFKVFGGGLSSASSSTASGSGATPTGDGPAKSAHAFKGRPAAKSVSFGHAPPWGQRQQPAAASPLHSSSSAGVRVPPTIPQGIPIPPSNARTALRPPEEHTGSLPGRVSGLLPQEKRVTLPSPASPTQQQGGGGPRQTGVKRPRANTSPWLPSFHGGDHQSWFNDPRFDGSFPSRVLPFLYLGNLNHASNVYMLHALGITHVVSVGECALLPPPYHMVGHPSVGSNNAGPACAPRGNAQRSGHGSLWIEEREGRIKVLDIKGVCDDGIDTLEPQLEPICDWIDKAREEGGQVLVHCRVGVSRSATVTIAYVMKHLSLPLVDAYLIVRSRRLSVLIQPNMRLLYNLCGWEIKLAKERAGWVDEVVNTGAENGGALVASKGKEKLKTERRLERELARTLTWPYLSMEVHKLNEKYLTAPSS